MKRIAFLLYALALMISAKAQTLNVNVGQVTYSYKSSQTGDMTYDGNTLTILGKTYNTADIADITIDNTTVGDSTINVVYAGNEAKVNVSGDIASMITAEVNGANVKIVQDAALERTVNYFLSGSSDNGSFYMDGNFKTNITLSDLTLSNPTDSLIYIDCGKKIYIILEGTNTLADGIGGTLFGWVNVWLGGEMMTHLVHHYTAWAIVLFTSGHLYSVTRAEFMEGESEVSSMFSGSKLLEHIPEDADEVDSAEKA